MERTDLGEFASCEVCDFLIDQTDPHYHAPIGGGHVDLCPRCACSAETDELIGINGAPEPPICQPSIPPHAVMTQQAPDKSAINEAWDALIESATKLSAAEQAHRKAGFALDLAQSNYKWAQRQLAEAEAGISWHVPKED